MVSGNVTIRSKKDIEVAMRQLRLADPKLGEIERLVPEVPLRLSKPGFAGLANIIISQQVSKASAAAISGRFFDFVNPATPDEYLKAGEEVWIKIGLSRPKQKTFSALCLAILEQSLVLEELDSLSAEDAIQKLTAVKGIGPWTAEVYLLFCIGHPDVFPAGDLALQEAIRVYEGLESRPDDKQSKEISQRWKPWRGVAARLLWAYYAVLKDGRDAQPLS